MKLLPLLTNLTAPARAVGILPTTATPTRAVGILPTSLLRLLPVLALTALLPLTSHADNPDPDPCCECIGFVVLGNEDKPIESKNTPMPSTDGSTSATVLVFYTGSEGCPDSVSGRVDAKAKGKSGPDLTETQNFTVGILNPLVVLTFTIDAHQVRMGSDWEFKLFCDSGSGTSGQASASESKECDSKTLKLSGGCGSCASGSCGATEEPSPESESFRTTFPTMGSNGGMTNGELVYQNSAFGFAGRAGLFANMPSEFEVTRDGAGLITKVETGTSIMEIADVTGEQAFTISHKDSVGYIFRTSKLSFVNEGGTDRLRLDTTFDNTTRRHEQTQPQADTLVMEQGNVVNNVFEPIRRETLIKDTSTPGIEIRRRTLEERSSVSQAFSTVSDIETTWEKQIHGWVKISETIDPDGAALTSTWSYYQPSEITGPGASTEGLGRLKHYVRYDGYESLHTYGLNYTSVVTPYTDNVSNQVTTSTWNPGSNTETTTVAVGGQTISKTVTVHTATTQTQTVYTSASETLTTVTHYVPSDPSDPLSQEFGGKVTKVIHPDGTLTTYSYTRETGGGYTTVMENGATTDNSTVSQGMRSITTTNSRGTTILRKTEAIGYGTGTTAFDLMAVSSVDNLGRPLATAYHPESVTLNGEYATPLNPKWTTTTAYNCCGVSEETDKYGITTRYAYDSLQRQIKTNRMGVTTETVGNGLTTETHRYPESVAGTLSPTFAGTASTLVAKSVRNLSGTLIESWSPDPTSTTAGALVKSSSTVTTYQPAAGLSTRTVTTSADSFTQTTDSFLDGKTATTSGDLSPDMAYAYSVNTTGQVTSQSYLDGTTPRETTTSQSDWAGRTLSTTYMDNAVASVEYNALGQMVKSTDPDGVTSLMAYNAQGERTITALDLNANGQIDYGIDQVSSSETDPALDGSAPVYVSTSKVWQPGDTSPAAGTVVSTSQRSPDGLSGSSQQLGVANPSTTLTILQGGADWTTSSTSPDGTYTVTTYADGLMDISENFDSDDNLIASSSMRDASNTAGSGYDSLNRPVAQRDSRTGVSTTAYLSTTADIVASVTSTDSTVTAFTYDIRGRRTAVDAPNAGGHDNITYTSYYPTGQVKATWGDQTYPRYHVYDGQNRLIALHTYNTAPSGEPTTTGDSVTTWVYNTQRGWLDRKEYNDGKGTNYTYTDAGRLATREWAREVTTGTPVTTTYGYDTAGRLTGVSYNDSTTPAVAYTYDSLGRVLTADNTVSANTYAYNADLTLATETIAVEGASSLLTRTLTRHYDTLLRPAGMELKDGTTVDNAVSYGYDTAGRLQSLAPSYPLPATHDFTYAYQPNSYGIVQSVTGPAHTVTNAWETDRNVLGTKTNADLSSTPVIVSAYDYTVNNIGQRESLATSGTAFNSDFRTLDWGYDALGQVIAEADSGATPDSRAFEFDAIGNRKKSADSLTLPTSDNYAVNALNQYTTVNANNPGYDDDGNLLDDAGINTGTSGDLNFIWDAENRLIEVKDESDGTTIATYAYDYLSRRIRKTVTSGEDTGFLYDGWNVIAEYDVTSTPTLDTTYTWGMDLSGSMQGAGGVGGLLAVNDGTNTFYPTYDGNGNVSEYFNASGTNIAHYEYDAFGNIVKATGSSEDFRYRFSTKSLDEEIGWYYYGYRYYDPLTGRWPSRDPIEEEGGYNLYGFVGNDGVNAWDYLGRWVGPDRDSSDSTSEVCAEEDDTWQELADLVGLNYSEIPKWVTNWSYIEDAAGPVLGKKYKVPNTIVAHWSGDVGGLGKFYVGWDGNVSYLKRLGFKVIESESEEGGDFALQTSLEFGSRARALHGMYYWGHGGFGEGNELGEAYPAIGLGSNTHGGVIDLLVQPIWLVSESGVRYQSPTLKLQYKMAAVFAFACDTNSLKDYLVSSNKNSIWHGYTGTLYPIFKTYGLKKHIKSGDQSTD